MAYLYAEYFAKSTQLPLYYAHVHVCDKIFSEFYDCIPENGIHTSQ